MFDILKKIVNFFFTIYWYVWTAVFLFGGIIVGTVLILFKRTRFVTNGMSVWAKILFSGGFKPIKTVGAENYEKGKSYLIVMNHSSYFDIPAAMHSFVGMKWLFKKELLKTPVLGTGIREVGFIPIDRFDFRHSLEAINKAVNTSGSISLAMFPEGTRSPDGMIHDFKRGFVRILKNSNLNILPVTLNGFYHFKPKNRMTYNFFCKLEVVVHPPIPNEELQGMDDKTVVNKVRSIIESSYVER